MRLCLENECLNHSLQFVRHLDYFSCQSRIDFRTLNTINTSNTIDTINSSSTSSTSQTSKISQFQWLNHSLQFVRHLNHFWCQSWIDFKSGIVQEEREPFLPILLVWVKLYFCRVSKVSAQQFSRKYGLSFNRTIKTASYLFFRFLLCFS